jgi:two-component system sensor histidine kinase PfeS
MTHRLFWKLCSIIATGVVALFYLLNLLTSHTEDGMSHLTVTDRNTLTAWGKQAEKLYLSNDQYALERWLGDLQESEETWVTVASYEVDHIAGNNLKESFYKGYNLGRNVDWKIHLYFAQNPVMEVPFENKQVSFLILLPDRMRPGIYLKYTEIIMQIIVPTILLAFLSYLLYRYIMKPLSQLQMATRQFSKGNFKIRAQKLMGDRNDEFSELAFSFDQMAERIGEQFINQRQLIADLSHELRTPLTRLDIALAEEVSLNEKSHNIKRIERESIQIRKLVEDTLTLAWLENEKPILQQESVELVDLLDVLVDDAKFEFPDRIIDFQLPNSALIHNSSHRAAGQALENILRNALRFTPPRKKVSIFLEDTKYAVTIHINDEGPGVPTEYLEMIFKPFFRLDKSREANSDSFGLGLALVQRQLSAIRATVLAKSASNGGLLMTVRFPKTLGK